MLFFRPGVYEEFIFKLASLRVDPPAQVWNAIQQRQETLRAQRRKAFFLRISVAATVLAFLGFGAISFHFAYNSTPELITANNPRYEIVDFDFITPHGHFVQQSSGSTASNAIIIKNIGEQETLFHAATELKPLAKISAPKFRTPHLNVTAVDDLKSLSSPSPVPLASREHPLEISNNPKPDELNAFRKKYNPWTISVSLSQAYSYHTLGFSNLNPYSNESGAWLLSGEVMAKKRISRKISLHTGLSVSPYGQNIENIILFTSSKVNSDMKVLVASTAYGWISLDNQYYGVINSNDFSNVNGSVLKSAQVNLASVRQRFYYLDIPILLSYSMFTKSAEFEVKLGGSAGILIGNVFEISGNHKKFLGETDGVNPYTYTLVAGIGISKYIGHNISLHLEPNFRIGVQPLLFNETATYPFSTSVKFGVSYKF